MSDGVVVRVKRVRPEADADLPLPGYATTGAAGFDVVAALQQPITLAPMERARVPTGIAMQIPAGFEVQVRPRSGLAWRHGLTVLNAPGTIDSDYRGEVSVILVNLGSEPVVIERGQRVAQCVLAHVATALLHEVARLDDTVRGAGGFGHTGR